MEEEGLVKKTEVTCDLAEERAVASRCFGEPEWSACVKNGWSSWKELYFWLSLYCLCLFVSTREAMLRP